MIQRTRSFLAAGLAGLLISTSPLAAFDTEATAAFVLDAKTGTVLMAKNADEAMPPASMSKLMTLYMAFEAVRDGRLDLNEELPVSEHAHSFGGSTMFLGIGERVATIVPLAVADPGYIENIAYRTNGSWCFPSICGNTFNWGFRAGIGWPFHWLRHQIFDFYVMNENIAIRISIWDMFRSTDVKTRPRYNHTVYVSIGQPFFRPHEFWNLSG